MTTLTNTLRALFMIAFIFGQHRISGLIYAVKTISKAKVSRYDHIVREIVSR
jgi:hypothetical protein